MLQILYSQTRLLIEFDKRIQFVYEFILSQSHQQK
jgi:hypothetical protein